MDKKWEYVRPGEIENRSFAIIDEELASRGIHLDPVQAPIIKRCIHTSADFDYAENLCFSDQAVEKGLAALRSGARIVTDTQMARAGINKKLLSSFGGEALCFMSDDDVAAAAAAHQTTRAVASMRKAASLTGPLIFAIGNAPTALIELDKLIRDGSLKPELVIGVPVGFVNVVEAKELIMTSGVPYIVAKGRKGGSNIAAAICNALLKMI